MRLDSDVDGDFSDVGRDSELKFLVRGDEDGCEAMRAENPDSRLPCDAHDLHGDVDKGSPKPLPFPSLHFVW